MPVRSLRKLFSCSFSLFYFFALGLVWISVALRNHAKQQRYGGESFLVERRYWPEPLCSSSFQNTSLSELPIKRRQVGRNWSFDTTSKGVVVYRDTDASAGWGNRLLGVASAFLLSIVLERPFYIDSERFSKAFAYGPEATSWNESCVEEDSPRGSTRALLRLVERDSLWERVWHGYRRQYQTLALTDPAWWFRDQHGARANIIYVESNQWFVPSLYLNPHLRPFLCSGFGNDVFRTVSRRIWVPNSFVDSVLKNFCARTNFLCSEEVNKSEPVLGVHIRSEASAPRWRPHRVRGPRLDSMLRCIALVQNKLEETHHKRALPVLVASDSATLLKALRGMRNAPAFLSLDPELDAKDVPPDFREYVVAAAEMILLSRCLYRVLSVGSTFGMCAQASSTSHHWPFVVTERGDCVQVPRSGPCQHHFYRLRGLSAFETIADFTNDRRFGCIL